MSNKLAFMKCLFLFLPLLLLTYSFFESSSWGWGEVGHETVGEIAERHLTSKAKNFVYEILGPEPLSAAAIFPDQVRSDARFNDFSDYHFITLPTGARYENLPASSKPQKDMYTILSKGAQRLIAPDASRDEKIVLLKYLIHVVGDAHQPLHVGPPGYLGGNLCDVKWKNPETGEVKVTNIHHFWDDLVIGLVEHEFHQEDPRGKPRWFGYKEFADVVTTAAKMSPLKVFEPETEFGEETFSNWFSEDDKLESILYPSVQGKSGANRAYCKKVDPITHRVTTADYDPAKIPLLDEAYLKKTMPILKDQIWKGGIRLASMLNSLAVAKGTKKMDSKKEKALLDSIKFENENHDILDSNR